MFDEPQTFADIARIWAARAGHRVALVSGSREVSWKRLHDRAARVAAGLRSCGLAVQDRVAILTRNAPEYFDVLFGASMANMVATPINWRLSVREMVAVLNDCECRVLVAESDLLGPLAAVLSDLGRLEKVLVVGAPSEDLGDARMESYEPWLAAQRADDPAIPVGEGDVVAQLYTSGTTGTPKGVMLNRRNVAGYFAGGELYGFRPASANLVVMPLFHVGGLWWSIIGMALGATTVLLREFDADTVLRLIARERITHALLVPAALQALVQSPAATACDLSAMRTVMYGASPISDEVLERCLELFACDFHQTYGLTETSGVLTRLGPEDHRARRHLRSAGRPLPGVTLKVVDPATGEPPDADEPGEIWVRSPQVMAGYWRREAETHAAITPDGWFRTGDIGMIRDGLLYLRDRLKDMIVSGGENIFPAEVENVLMAHPAVRDAAVIGVPSERWGEEVKAIVVAATGEPLTAAELIAFARTRLAGYKVPKSVTFVSALPRNPSGKVLKKELRAPYWAGRQRQIS
ncbi:MAG: long-chain-fatty-acid--CoA ligase [Caulobacterales bacterium]|nr:long-chain-fatty-acid--CoA ligase [Caulobacterales bacterium]